MFPRGPRFEPTKVSDVPGPNSYNPDQESQLDGYKRGAFLEKTDRFSKEKESDVPGPGAYDVETKNLTVKPTANPLKQRAVSQNLADRYATLQRKVEELEKVHNEGKKSHQQEIERLKLDLARSQKLNMEQVERLDKQKKQTESFDLRIQDLKKSSASDQAEIKDLRFKLRMSEHDRTQLVSKQGEAGELRKSLQAMDLKRKEEVRDRDRRITELEKTLSGEKKKRDIMEARLQELKEKGNDEIQAARAEARTSEALLYAAKVEAQAAQSSLVTQTRESTNKEAALLEQLEQYRQLLNRVAEEYGRLASTSIPLSAHTQTQIQVRTLQLRTARLERKLANSEGQVVELANLIRQSKEANLTLAQQLQETENHVVFLNAALEETQTRPSGSEVSVLGDLDTISQNLLDEQREISTVDQKTFETVAEFYRLTFEELLLVYSILDQELRTEQGITQQHATDLSSVLASHEAIAARLESVQKERAAIDEQLKAATNAADKEKTSSENLTRRLAEMEKKLREASTSHEAALKNEKEVTQRMTGAVQKSRMAEEAMRVEIEQLTVELTDVERYQEAYYSLSDEVGALLARNQLAEDEAQRLSKFNAEILGHNNPAQRIMYVDRIRRELAEAKHKIIILTREQEMANTENDELQHELNMYKSVAVPVELKPRTTITRVTRPPLVNLARSINTGSLVTNERAKEGSVWKSSLDVPETIPGDMTLDEII